MPRETTSAIFLRQDRDLLTWDSRQYRLPIQDCDEVAIQVCWGSDAPTAAQPQFMVRLYEKLDRDADLVPADGHIDRTRSGGFPELCVSAQNGSMLVVLPTAAAEVVVEIRRVPNGCVGEAYGWFRGWYKTVRGV